MDSYENKVVNAKLIIFDWSGTISNDIKACYEAGMKLRKHYKLSVIPFDQWRKKTMTNAIDFLRAHGVEDDEDNILGLFSRYYSESTLAHKPEPFSDTEDTLAFFHSKGKTIAVVSGHPNEHLSSEMISYGFDKFISTAFGSVKDKAEKLRELADKFGIKKSEIIYIGDMVWDIRAAKKAGVLSAAILRGYHSEERLVGERPNLIIDSLTDLKKLLI